MRLFTLIFVILFSSPATTFAQEGDMSGGEVSGGEVSGGEIAGGEVAGGETTGGEVVDKAISDAASAAAAVVTAREEEKSAFDRGQLKELGEAVAKVKAAEKLASLTRLKMDTLLGEEEERPNLGKALNPLILTAAEKPGFSHCTVVTVQKACQWWNVLCNDDLSLEIDTGVLGTYVSKDAYTDGPLAGRVNVSLVCHPTDAKVRIMEADMFGAKGVVRELRIFLGEDGWETVGDTGDYRLQFTKLN